MARVTAAAAVAAAAAVPSDVLADGEGDCFVLVSDFARGGAVDVHAIHRAISFRPFTHSFTSRMPIV